MQAPRAALPSHFTTTDWKIISAGELHFGLTPEMLFQPHESTPWNPWIASVFYRRGLIETWGGGTLKIASQMQDAGLQPPTIVENAGFVIMTFVMPDRRTSEKMSEKVLAALRRDGKLTISALAIQFGVTTRTIERTLKKRQEENRLSRIGQDKGGHWKVGG